MEAFKFEYIENILLILSLIMSSSAVITMISTVVKKAQSPEERQNERIRKLEDRLDEIDGFLKSDKERLGQLAEVNRITLEGVSALLGHSQHGNNEKEMRDAEKKINEYLRDNL